MGEVVHEYVRKMKIAAGLNEQLVFDAWDIVSGAAGYTVSRYLKDGVLYCSISSSVVRNRLFFQKQRILELINAFLMEDDLFVKDGRKTVFVKDVVLR